VKEARTVDKHQQAARLIDDLDHLTHELAQLVEATQGLTPGTPAWERARRDWKELNDTYSTKEQMLRQLSGTAPQPLAGALAFAQATWAASEQELLEEKVLPLNPPPPSAVGGARYVTDVNVGHYMLAAFLQALKEFGGAVVSTRPSIGCKGHIYESTWYTISLESVDHLFEVGRFMVLNYYTHDSPATHYNA
jgi:hypothetical protein